MNLGVLASHEGTTLQSLFDAFAGGRIPGRVSVVVSNNGDSGALVKARQAGVQAVHLSSRTHRDPATLDAAIRDVLVAAAVDVVFLAGYLKKLGPFVLGTFHGRILNTHPALLPRFGGRGMYGDRVFEAVLEAGEAESGVSIHLIDPEYDTGRSCVNAKFRFSGMTPSTISRPACGHERKKLSQPSPISMSANCARSVCCSWSRARTKDGSIVTSAGGFGPVVMWVALVRTEP